MPNKNNNAASQKIAKAKWATPVLKTLTAGSAEVNTGTIDDGDPGSALNNS